MTDSERIISVLDYTGQNINSMAKNIGLKTAQSLYDIRNGKHGISKDIAEKINAKYVEIDVAWLLTGKGTMTKSFPKIVIPPPTPVTNQGIISNDILYKKVISSLETTVATQKALIAKLESEIQRLQRTIDDGKAK